MVLPILPLIDDLASWGAKKAYASLVGQVLLDGSSLNKDEIVQFAKEEEVPLVILSLPNAKFSDDEIIAFLNNGVSSLFIASQDAKIVDHLIEELNVPKNRIVVEENSVFYNQFLVKQKFSQDRIVSIKDLTKDLLIKEVIAEVRTDRPDGLFTTLVVDQYERCLGLVYSSKESIAKAIELGRGVYYSRSRNEIWVKGETSGNGQKLLQISTDCDSDALKFIVEQENVGFCHLETMSCFGEFKHGLVGLESLLKQRLQDAPKESYTRRLFNDSALLDAKIKEEAEELTEAKGKQEISWEAADLFYFALAKLVANNVSLKDVENNLNMKHLKITRRKGDAKPKFVEQAKVEEETPTGPIHLHVVNASDKEGIKKALSRPIQKTSEIMHLVNPIIENVRDRGDSALLEYTEKFDGVKLSTPVLNAPFPEEYFEGLTEEMKDALDLSIENVRKFHAAQLPKETLEVETQPGVLCSRFPRPIEKVGLYIPGGTAILPSTALMLGVPAQVAQCKEIIFASPPRKSDGKVSPEVVYVAEKVGASKIVLAGGAQAVAAMAYGTESIPKVDKVLGPGNQFVTAAKMYVQNDTQALCSIDMPAGPSEVLVIADEDADADFVASDLLSQAEHGIDSQVILVGIKLSEEKIQEIQDAVHNQAMQLPRVDIVRKCIAHSTIILCEGYEEALDMSNKYAPEHLILQIANANDYVKLVDNAGSVFVGAYTPESCGDYSSGTNHTLPTYGYARQYSGANTATFQKFITAQNITPEGLENIGRAVMCVAKKEGLDGHRNAVKIRMSKLGLIPKDFQ